MADPRVDFAWPGGVKAAASLSFDGGLVEHWRDVAPALESEGIKATFFISPTALVSNAPKWQAVVKNGHQSACHSLYGVTDEGRLPNWTQDMVRHDLKMSQSLFSEVLGAEATAFALPGIEPTCSEGSYLPSVDRWFDICRTCLPGVNGPATVDLRRLRSIDARGLPLQAMIDLGKDAIQSGSWLVLAVEAVDVQHLEFAKWLAANRDAIWAAPISEVAEHLGTGGVRRT